MVVFFFCVRDLRRPEHADLSRKEKFKRIDSIGLPLNIVFTLCLVLGLQWAGTEYQWSNWRIILLLVLAAVFFGFFLYAEWKAGDKAMVPLKMLSRRTVAFANINQFCNVGGLSVIAYYVSSSPPLALEETTNIFSSLPSTSKPSAAHRLLDPVSCISPPRLP